MARVPDLIRFCGEHHMKMLAVAELIRYRMETEGALHAEERMPPVSGPCIGRPFPAMSREP